MAAVMDPEPEMELAPPEPDPPQDEKKKKKPKKEKKPRKKRKWVLPVILVLVAALLAGAGFAIFTGLVKVPFWKPGPPARAKPAASAKAAAPAKPSPPKPAAPAPRAIRPRPAAPVTPKPTTRIDPDAGARALARVWERIPPDRVVEISRTYRETELARVLAKMDSRKSAAIVATLEPARAGRVSREIERLASVVPLDP